MTKKFYLSLALLLSMVTSSSIVSAAESADYERNISKCYNWCHENHANLKKCNLGGPGRDSVKYSGVKRTDAIIRHCERLYRHEPRL